MKIRTSLTLKYTAITATVFLLSMLVIYGLSERARSEAFFHDLRREGITKAHLFLSGQVDPATMQSIYRNNKRFIDEVEVAVYTPDFRMLYHDAASNDIVKEDSALMDRVVGERLVDWYVGRYQAVGILYEYGGKRYVVTAAAYDGYGYATMRKLRDTLAGLFGVGLTLLFGVGYLFARGSLRPIRRLAMEAEEISASRIDKRLVAHDRDEVGELALAFNALLDRLESSFEAQRMFVSNVSHELRTPLAALTAELDLTLQRERDTHRYQEAMRRALSDAHRMGKLIDGLLNLAKADYGKERIAMREVRIDELLMEARGDLLRAHRDYHIEIVFDGDTDDERLITVQGNPYLLTIAFTNLIDNNCKYSTNHRSLIQIAHWEKWAIIRLSDTGVGIPEEERERLFDLFHRGEQARQAEGHGIGMALARKIIQLHGGRIAVLSQEGEGTTFLVEIPHL